MAKNPELLALRQVRAGHGAPPVLEDVDLSIAKGDRLVLVGRNGSGKSTLLAALEGALGIDAGQRYVRPGTSIATLPQDPQLPDCGTVLDFVCVGGAERYRAEALVYALGLTPDAAVATLSGGQSRRASLAAALAQDPDILLLDEPTNHLDLPTIEWLEKELVKMRGGLLVVSHDRAFLNRIGTGIVWLDRRVVRRLDAPFAKFENWVDAQARKEEQEMNLIDQQIRAEKRYRLKGVTARRKRNQRRVRKLIALRQEKQEKTRDSRTAAIKTQGALQSGKLVLEAKNISKSYGDTVIARDFSLRIQRADRIGLIGPNGAGKTTLIKMLIGEISQDSGSIRRSRTLEIAWFDQTRQTLNPDSTPWDVIGEGTDRITVNGQDRHVIGYLKDFLFDERQARGKIRTLSGGEKNRLMLAKLLMRPANLLVLDEPTNDLDMETLDLLEEMLGEYDGSLILVSHDRDFLDRLVTSVIAVEGQGRIGEYVGGYYDYLRQRKRQDSRPEATPKAPLPFAGTRTGSNVRKLTYNDQRALELLPDQMESLAEEIENIHKRLDDPDFFMRDPAGFQTDSVRLKAARDELFAAEEKWLALELLKEELST